MIHQNLKPQARAQTCMDTHPLLVRTRALTQGHGLVTTTRGTPRPRGLHARFGQLPARPSSALPTQTTLIQPPATLQVLQNPHQQASLQTFSNPNRCHVHAAPSSGTSAISSTMVAMLRRLIS